MSLIDDINNLPATPQEAVTGHLNHHATIHSALKNHNSQLNTISSPNLLTTEGGQDGVVLSADGTLIGSDIRWTSDFIPVEKSTEYVWSRDGQLFTAGGQLSFQQYRADKTRIGGLRTGPALTSDINAAFFKASILKSQLPVAQLEKGTIPTAYVAHGALKASDINIDGVGSVSNEMSSIRALSESAATPAIVDEKIAPLQSQIDAAMVEIREFTGPNLLSTAGGQDGVSLSADGTLIGAGDRRTSGFIPVEKLTAYVWSRDGQLFTGDQCIWQQYTAAKARIGGLRTGSSFTTDTNGAFVRASILKTLVPVAQLEKGTVPTAYMAHDALKSSDITIDGVGSVREELSSIRTLAASAATPAIVDEKIAPLKSQLDAAMIEIREFTGPNLLTTSGGQYDVSLTTGGVIIGAGDRWTSDFIPVEKLTDYVWSRDGVVFTGDQCIWQQYNTAKTAIGGTRVGPAFTTDANGAFVRASILKTLVPVAQLEKGTTPTQYVPHGAIRADDIRVGDIQSLIQALYTMDMRISTLESAPPTPPTSGAKSPDDTLVWEEMSHVVRRIATAYDGNVYGQMTVSGVPRLCRSTDSGLTFEPGWPIVSSPFGSSGIATWTVWEDGSVTAIGHNGKIFRQDSFDTEPRLVYETTTGNALNRLPESTYSDGTKRYIFAAEYDHTPDQKMVYYSTDAGETWGILKEGDTDNTGNNHWHAVGYDPYRDAVWLSQGDGINSRLYVTFDWGQTWHHKMEYQPTSIFAFPDRLALGRDEDFLRPGISGTDGTLPITITDDLTFRPDKKAYAFYPNRTSWNKSNNEYYLLFPPNPVDGTDAYIWATGDGGMSWHPVYIGTQARMGLAGVDKNGYLFATNADYGAPLLRAKTLAWRDA